MLNMREWMREKMRRRSKRGPNTSESTGKIGQEIPSDQPQPLRPAYPEPMHSQRSLRAADQPTSPKYGVYKPLRRSRRPDTDASTPASRVHPPPAPAPEGKLEVETQPESAATFLPRSRRRRLAARADMSC